MSKVIISYNWIKRANIIIDNSKFKIYGSISKTYISNKIYNIIKVTRLILKIWKILDNIKSCFFEFDELIFGFIARQKDKYFML